MINLDISKIEEIRIDKVESQRSNQNEREVLRLKKSINESTLNSKEIDKLMQTLEFALAQDYDNTPQYVAHPIRVAMLCLFWLKEVGEMHADLLHAALIHNALEKNILSINELEIKFGPWVSKTIEILTIDREAQKHKGWETPYYEAVHSLDKYGQMLKVFDKFDNIYALVLNPDDQVRTNYLIEIDEYIQPMMDEFFPAASDYLKELIKATREMGHKPQEFFLGN